MSSAHRIDAPDFDTVWDGLGLDEQALSARTRGAGMGGPVGCLLVGCVILAFRRMSAARNH